MEDFKVIKKLGAGGQGSTYTALRLADNRSFVIKQVVCKNISEGNYALKEAKVLQKFSHASIVKYEDMFLHETKDEANETKLVVCIVMELCEKGDMASTMLNARRQKSMLSESNVLRWMSEMCSGLAYLHHAKTLHRDLKPMNIFVTQSGSIKIGDFGLARKVVNDKMSRVGTPCYLAPEVLASETYGEAADIWGLGCIALEMLSLNFLWEDKGLLAMKVQAKPVTPAEMSGKYDNTLRQAICTMLLFAPEKRPSAQHCVNFLASRGGAPKAPPPKPAPTPQQLEKEALHQRAKQQDKAEEQTRQEQINLKQRQAAAAAAEQAAAAAAAARVHAHHQKLFREQQQQQQQQPQQAGQREGARGQEREGNPAARPPLDIGVNAGERVGRRDAGRGGGNRDGGAGAGRERAGAGSEQELWEATRHWREKERLGGEELVQRAMVDRDFVEKFTNSGEATRYELMHRSERLSARVSPHGHEPRHRARGGEGAEGQRASRLRNLCLAAQQDGGNGGAGGAGEKAEEDGDWVRVGREGMARKGSWREKEKEEAPTGSPGMMRREGSGIRREGGGGLGGSKGVGVAMGGKKGSFDPAVEFGTDSPQAGASPMAAGAERGGQAAGEGGGGVGETGLNKAEFAKIFKQGNVEYEKAIQVSRQAAEMKGEWKQIGPDKSDVFRGAMVNGMAHGLGAVKKKNGEKFAGEFEHDVYHGYGEIFFPDNTRYVGQFRHGMMHGWGYLKMGNGDRYKGSFEEGVFCGYGEYVTASTGASELGVYKEGKLLKKLEVPRGDKS